MYIYVCFPKETQQTHNKSVNNARKVARNNLAGTPASNKQKRHENNTSFPRLACSDTVKTSTPSSC